MTMSLARATAECNHLFTGYALNLIKAQIAVIEGMVKAEHGNVVEGQAKAA
ncbi:hypothetical protein D3C78_1670540 [compost metagenome]